MEAAIYAASKYIFTFLRTKTNFTDLLSDLSVFVLQKSWVRNEIPFQPKFKKKQERISENILFFISSDLS